jgi:hypothetical protein
MSGYHLDETQRVKVCADCVTWYKQGVPVRGISKRIGRSYGFTRKLLADAGVLRGVGRPSIYPPRVPPI